PPSAACAAECRGAPLSSSSIERSLGKVAAFSSAISTAIRWCSARLMTSSSRISRFAIRSSSEYENFFAASSAAATSDFAPADATLSSPRHDLERRVLSFDFFRFADVTKTADQLVDGDLAKREFLQARQNRRRHLLDLGGGEHEDDVRRRFLNQLQQRVPCRRGEHVRLVDDEDAKAIARRLELRDV